MGPGYTFTSVTAKISSIVLTRRAPRGMWLERFIIVVTSLQRDFLPSSWGMYSPTIWDWGAFIGSIGLFFCLLFVFIRFLPMISISEMRTLLPEAEARPEGGQP
jgi:molybdopterin-containing oxidoreductase family membrane subunit